MSPRRKLGCLSFLILFPIACYAGWALTTAAFAPWIFEASGHFHVLPFWQGLGRLHSQTSGDYEIYVYFYSTPAGGRNPGTWVEGQGYLCTAHGDRYTLHLSGGTSRRIWSHMDGEPFRLGMATRPPLWALTNSNEPPQIALRGRWQYPVLVMDDAGSLSHEFAASGRLYGASEKHPQPHETVPVTLSEGTYSQYVAACEAIAHRRASE